MVFSAQSLGIEPKGKGSAKAVFPVSEKIHERKGKKMKEVKRVCYKKEGRDWKETFTDTDREAVYRWLAHDLEAKYICRCAYITRIKRQSNYDGTANITVWYDNEIKNVYTIEN